MKKDIFFVKTKISLSEKKLKNVYKTHTSTAHATNSTLNKSFQSNVGRH